MSQIYVKYSLYIQSYYFNFTFAKASLWRVQLCNQSVILGGFVFGHHVITAIGCLRYCPKFRIG